MIYHIILYVNIFLLFVFVQLKIPLENKYKLNIIRMIRILITIGGYNSTRT